MPSSRKAVDNVERRVGVERVGQFVVEALASPSTMRWSAALRPSRRASSPPCRRLCGRQRFRAASAAGHSLRGDGQRSGLRPPALLPARFGQRMILDTCTMAPLIPLSPRGRGTPEFSTWRAAGLRRTKCSTGQHDLDLGESLRIAAMPSSVHWPSLRSSSLPVAIVNVSGSIIRSD